MKDYRKIKKSVKSKSSMAANTENLDILKAIGYGQKEQTKGALGASFDSTTQPYYMNFTSLLESKYDRKE